MECLSDFGTQCHFFSISTFTTGIYNAWISFDDLVYANRLSFFLLVFIFALFIIENYSRKKAKYHSPNKSSFKSRSIINLKGNKALFAFLFCSTIFFISFLFPVLQMLYWTILFPKHFLDLQILKLLFNTVILVTISSFVLISLAFISNYGNRISNSKLLEFLTTFSVSGYAIPGVILAVAFITFISWFDNSVMSFFNIHSIKSIFIGSLMGLILVYFIRFFSLANNGIKSGYLKMNYSIDESAYLLGYSKFKTFKNIHFPYLKNSMFLIGILISIEIIKELPITLIMRPFNFETFATSAYIFASQDLLEAAAAPSIILVIIASFFILITSKYILDE